MIHTAACCFGTGVAGSLRPVGGGGPFYLGIRRGFVRLHQGRSGFFRRTRPQFMVDTFLPSATHIRDSEAFASDVQRYIQALPGVTHVTSFIGGGGLRFMLVYSPEGENRAFVQFLVDVDDWRKIDGLMADIQRHLDEQHPNANSIAEKFLLGPRGRAILRRFRAPIPHNCAPSPIRRREFSQTTAGRWPCAATGVT